LKVSIIVPNYNGFSILENCLESLLSQNPRPDQIVVVDNGSSDGSQEKIVRRFPTVHLVCLEENTGFTGANNAGLRASKGDLLVLLNNDCIVESNWLAGLLGRMEEPSVAAVTSSMRNIADGNIMDSAGGEIDWMGFSRDIGKGEPASSFGEAMDLPFPCGGAVMIRRCALPDPGRIFWPVLFIYQEDLDLGFELLRTGWRVVYEPSAVVRHMHSATMGRGSFRKEYHCTRNRFLVLRKHFRPGVFARLLPVMLHWQALWFFASAARGRFVMARALLKGTRDGLRLPVNGFEAGMSLSSVFAGHAVGYRSVPAVKRALYARAERIIRADIRG
jgi:GT2 family glycosyltransferase